MSTESYKKLGYSCIGNLALIGLVINKLKKANATSTKPAEILTLKNILYGYIAMSSSLATIPATYAQISFFSNIPSTFPNWFLNKYFPHSIDPDLAKPAGFNKRLLLKRIFLMSLFALHHSIFARHSVKKFMSDNNIIPSRIERIMYTNFSSLLMLYLIRNWNDDENKEQDQKDDQGDSKSNYLWRIPVLSDAPWIIQYFPFMVFIALGAIAVNTVTSQEDFSGITAAFDVNHGATNGSVARVGDNEFSSKGMYKLVRHPQMLCNIMAFLVVPRMSVSRLTLTVLFGFYVVIGIQFEEKGLIEEFGKQYIEYQKKVPQLIPTWSSLSNYISSLFKN